MNLRRREFIGGLVGAAASWPLVGRAQQRTAMPVIGYLGQGTPEATTSRFIAAISQRLERDGFREGRDVAIEYRWAEGHYLPAPSGTPSDGEPAPSS